MPDRLRLILGVKLRTLRHERGLGLKDVARKAGLSVSYLSEIEQGKKYPKPDRLVDLAHALGVPYDDLVSVRVDKGLDAVKHAIDSPLLRSFPFALFGVDPEQVVGLLAGMPDRAGALVQAVGDVARVYDAQVEDFLLAALRAYQQVHANRFPDLEAVAERVRQRYAWDGPPTAEALRGVLEGEHGYRIDRDRLPTDDLLRSFRSVLVPAEGARGPTLYVNGQLREDQLAFLYARELGFLELDATDRPLTSSWVRVDSFEQVIDHFRGSYVAGALLLPAAPIDATLEQLADADAWDPDALLGLLSRLRTTPETLFHRLTQRIPDALGIDELFFLRFHHDVGTGGITLTKTFNLSQVPVPHGVAADEHYCRRWPSMAALAELDRRQARAAGLGESDDGPVVVAQRQHFVDEAAGGGPADFFVVAVARPLSLRKGVNSAVSLGLRLTRATKRAVRFWDDPTLPRVDAGLTCERCPIADCRVRAAPATVLRQRAALDRQAAALADLAAEGRPPAG